MIYGEIAVNNVLYSRNVNKVTISYLLVKNYDKNSALTLDARQTQSFYVGKLKFNQTENLIFADRYNKHFLMLTMLSPIPSPSLDRLTWNLMELHGTACMHSKIKEQTAFKETKP